MNHDLSLLDAVFTRAREGLRVLEDVARFGLSDVSTASDCRTMRHTLHTLEHAFGGSVLLHGRQAGETKPLPVETVKRQSLLGVIRANASRAGQALRTLEEFVNAYGAEPDMLQLLAESRYRLYQAELTLAKNTPHYWLEWYNIGGFVYAISASVEELIEYIDSGARIVQLRDKDSSRERVFEKTKELVAHTSAFNKTHHDEKVLVIVNDYLEIAAALPVAGVHIGQEDRHPRIARQLLGSNKIIGRSNHSLHDLAGSLAAGADYVSFGPVYATSTKPDRKPVGLEMLGEAVKMSDRPLVAIGGIHPENAQNIYAAGARNLAVISAARDFF